MYDILSVKLTETFSLAKETLQLPMSVRSFISLLPKPPSLSESIIEHSSASSSQPSSHLHHHLHHHHHHHLHNQPHLFISRLLSFSACLNWQTYKNSRKMEDFEQNKVHLLKILLNNLTFFLFPKFLELFFTPKNTPPKVKNSKPFQITIFFWDTLYILSS